MGARLNIIASIESSNVSAFSSDPSDLSDHEWEILAPLILPAKPGGRPRKWSMHKVLNAVFYVVRTGCQWRLLPHDFPPWSTVHHYFRLRRLDGTWERINAVLGIVDPSTAPPTMRIAFHLRGRVQAL